MVELEERRIILHPGTGAAQAWYIAHELGHILLPGEFGEVSCDIFAYCILMPHEWVERDAVSIAPAQLATWYGVTPTVVKRRLRLLHSSSRHENRQHVQSLHEVSE
jgi:Zn-dependent peptidase ImmA (M78 family)